MSRSLTRSQAMDAIDRHGSRLAAWPAHAPAAEVRAAVLADRELRAYLDGARVLDEALARAGARRDAAVAASGAAERIAGRLTGAAPPRQRRWAAVAAALVVAAGLGSAVDLGLVGRPAPGPQVVVLDPLVFGPAEEEGR